MVKFSRYDWYKYFSIFGIRLQKRRPPALQVLCHELLINFCTFNTQDKKIEKYLKKTHSLS